MKKLAGTLVFVLLALAPPGVAATTTTTGKGQPVDPRQEEIAGQIRSLRSQVEEASAEEAQLLERIDAAEARKRLLDTQLSDLDRRLTGLERQAEAARLSLAGLESQQRAAETLLADARSRLAAARVELQRQAIASYTGRNEASRYAGVVLRATDPAEMAATRAYVKVVVGSQREAIRRLERWRDRVQELGAQLERSRAQARAQQHEVEGQQAQLEQVRRSAAGLRLQVSGEIAQGDRARSELLARKREFTAQIEALQRESEALAATLRRRQAGRPPAPSRVRGRLARPVPGAPVTSGYGSRTHPVFGDTRMHNGVDFGAPTGAAVHAAGDGVVVTAGSLGGYGNTVVIDHGGSLATLYAHLSQVSVAPGQEVSRNQVVGRVGCTGYCTGPHLHFEVRVNGNPVDPMPYLG